MRRDEIGNTLQQYRRARKLTLKQVSEMTGLSISGISDTEQGRNTATWETLERLGKVYDFTPEIVLFGREYDETSLNELIAGIADMRSVFFKACPASYQDHRFMEMMGSPECVIGYVTEYLARIGKGLEHITELQNEHRKANKPISFE